MRMFAMLALFSMMLASLGWAQTPVQGPTPAPAPAPQPVDTLDVEVSYPVDGEFTIDFETNFDCATTPIVIATVNGGPPRVIPGIEW